MSGWSGGWGACISVRSPLSSLSSSTVAADVGWGWGADSLRARCLHTPFFQLAESSRLSGAAVALGAEPPADAATFLRASSPGLLAAGGCSAGGSAVSARRWSRDGLGWMMLAADSRAVAYQYGS
jgi:hypothetical protein